MLEELTFRTDRMREACKAGFLNATELADYLVGKGIPSARRTTSQVRPWPWPKRLAKALKTSSWRTPEP